MGEVFAGRYELVDLIGEGGMGTVWRAWDRKAARHVAAKVLRQSDAATLLRFVREQSVRIHDPHVVVPLGWAGEDDRVLFTMPIIRGGSVATLVADFGPIPPLVVAEVIRQILSGLVAVHAASVVHRDIKPANILLDATGRGRPHAYLSDFGIAVDLTAPRWTHTGVVSGTPGYLAPELEATGEVQPAADLYAVGQVALTMITGARPALRGRGLRPADIPVAMWSVVQRLVAAHPEDRPLSAAAALAALQVPELSWSEDAIGEMEVFDQMAALGTADAADPMAIAGQPGAPRVARDADEEPTRRRSPSATPVRGSAREALFVGLIVVVALAGVLLIWSPWQGRGEPSGSSTTPASGQSPNAVPSGSSPSTAGPSAPLTSTGPRGTTGTVRVGTLVSRVGQPCEFTDVGRRGQTVQGVVVTCAREPNGAYAWNQP